MALLFLLGGALHAQPSQAAARRPADGADVRLPARPTVYEINTAVWLERLGRERGRPLQLSEVPGASSGTRWRRCRSTPCG